MQRVIVEYTTRSDRSDENQRLIEAVFAELRESNPEGIRYAAFRLADGMTFVHVASIETEDGSNPLGANQAFGEFQREIGERCTVPPAARDATLVGSYGLFD